MRDLTNASRAGDGGVRRSADGWAKLVNLTNVVSSDER